MTPARLRLLDELCAEYLAEHGPHPAVREALDTVRRGLRATITVETLCPDPPDDPDAMLGAYDEAGR